MNQCDGCRAGKPLVKLVAGQFVEDKTGNTHIMGDPNSVGYLDLMGCERGKYLLEEVAACTCYLGCGDDSWSGRWHQHEGDPCPVHPDAPMVG